MVLLHHSEECLEQPYSYFVSTFIVVAVAREVALGLELEWETSLVADDVDLSVLDGADRVNDVAEACDTGSEGAAHISVDECHLRSLVEVLVVHIVDDVQGLHVDTGEPVHHVHEARHELVVCQHVALDRTELRTALLTGLGVYTAGDSVCETLCEIGASTEELHLLACLSCADTTADAVVVAPYRTHHVVVLVLYRAGLNGNHSSVLLEVHRQT